MKHWIFVLILFIHSSCEKNRPIQITLPVDYDSSIPIALTDALDFTYLGFERGLYPGGSNIIPEEHLTRGLFQASQIIPRNHNGDADVNGKVVLLSVGMSNTSLEFCNSTQINPLFCRQESFVFKANLLPNLNASLIILNGAQGGRAADDWLTDASSAFDNIESSILTPSGVTENQVQIVWLKIANRQSPTMPSLPSYNADAYVLLENLGNIIRSIKTRYPNVKQIFISSRIYGGYASLQSNSPEPYAFESGFAVKWLIESQINQLGGGDVNPITGSITLENAAWLAWGPYIWAPGSYSRNDGLIWLRDDFALDGIHPSVSGKHKVSDRLLDFFKNIEFTRCWFLSGYTC